MKAGIIGVLLLGIFVLSGCGPTPVNNSLPTNTMNSVISTPASNTPSGNTAQADTSGNVADGTGSGENSNQSDVSNGPLAFYFHVWKLDIPGTVVTTDNYDTNTRTTTITSGLSLPGALRINANGTYDWNSSWAGKVIHGQWTASNDSEYPITLLNGEDNHDWQVGTSTDGKGIIIWDKVGSIWKDGVLVK